MREWINLTESLNGPLPYRWEYKSDKSWEGHFDAGDQAYTFFALRMEGFPHPDDHDRDGDWYDLAFTLTHDGFSGTRVIGLPHGMANKIFATVIAMIRDVLTEQQPELIMLSASKENLNRLPLYRRIASRVSPELEGLGYRRCTPPRYRHMDLGNLVDMMAWRKV